MEFIKTPGRANSQLPPVLIFPALSIGNVGQLAVDLLISSRTMTRAGFLDDPYVLPCVGNDPFGPEADGTLAVALEVFEDSENGLAIVQQRSPVVKGKMVEFAEHVAAWAESSGVKEIVILSGLDSAKRQRGEQRRVGPQIQYLSTGNRYFTNELCMELGWQVLEQADQLIPLENRNSPEVRTPSEVQLTDDNYFAGLPFASLYAACLAKRLKILCLLHYCSEGDNMPDAYFVAESLYQILRKKQQAGIPSDVQWKIPLSWATVYGPPPDDTIF